MTKIQLFQLVAILALVIFVIYSYQAEATVTWLFYLIAVINIVLWILRMNERRKN
ncbi:hypothetical protein [Halalkalibacter krulwichiae]|uniref:Uncharacterized protein n=1 Tax=Halalkalibacter krulwichiae TaxID=199441 RepID=A0A1X9ML44_9BACI|nr:hypothetical protein [Halalkalibacter krulwichiae]ARK31472.1 hypothetical protein BkAM31D_17395 [Halalkalibacter krulwichiae]